MNTINLKDVHSHAITNSSPLSHKIFQKSFLRNVGCMIYRYICEYVTKHLSPNFQNAKQVQNCVPKERKRESKTIPKHHFNTKHISGYLQMCFKSLIVKTHHKSFPRCSLNLPLIQQCLQRALDSQFICQSSPI